VALAIFDLDNTLISDDSDYLWGQFLVDNGIVDKELYEEANIRFYDDYKQGKLDIVEFLHFSLAPLANNDPEQLFKWRSEFIETIIKPIQLKPAIRLVNKHRFKGDTVLVITATNRFVTEPIVALFRIDNLLATTPEFIDNRFTGNFEGIPCFQEGKVKLLKEWLKDSKETMENSFFYSDSYNDIPLLEIVDNPVAVDPDEKLREHASEKNWSIISLRT
jgi:HAD superfamily hydrolase (TIGR01490 family)